MSIVFWKNFIIYNWTIIIKSKSSHSWYTPVKAKIEPPAEIIVRLAHYYDVTCDEILDKNNLFKNKEVREKDFDNLNNEIADLYKQIENCDKLETQNEVARKILQKTEQLKNFIENVSKSAFDDSAE